MKILIRSRFQLQQHCRNNLRKCCRSQDVTFLVSWGLMYLKRNLEMTLRKDSQGLLQNQQCCSSQSNYLLLYNSISSEGESQSITSPWIIQNQVMVKVKVQLHLLG